MRINLSPIRADAPRTLARQGDVLTVDGVEYDFGPLGEGDELPAEAVGEWCVGPIRREGGEIVLTMILPHGRNAPEATRFPAPIIDPPDGPVALPPHDTEAD